MSACLKILHVLFLGWLTQIKPHQHWAYTIVYIDRTPFLKASSFLNKTMHRPSQFFANYVINLG
jgi:hypothetical protein